MAKVVMIPTVRGADDPEKRQAIIENVDEIERLLSRVHKRHTQAAWKLNGEVARQFHIGARSAVRTITMLVRSHATGVSTTIVHRALMELYGQSLVAYRHARAANATARERTYARGFIAGAEEALDIVEGRGIRRKGAL